MMITDKEYDVLYSWQVSNALFGECLEDIRTTTVRRMPKTATMKRNAAKGT